MGVKLKDILKGAKIGGEIGKLFLPGAAGKIADLVSKSLEDDNDPGNAEAVKALTAKVVALEEFNRQLIEVLKDFEQRLQKLEAKK